MASPLRSVRWHSSFYWRIGISFVVFVVVVLVAQSLMVGYARSSGAFAPGNANATAAAIAAELGKALTDDPYSMRPDSSPTRFLIGVRLFMRHGGRPCHLGFGATAARRYRATGTGDAGRHAPSQRLATRRRGLSSPHPFKWTVVWPAW